MTESLDEIAVVDNPDLERFEARLDGRVVGVAEYALVAGIITFLHTEVDPAYEGKGIASRLAAGALDAVRSRGMRMRVECPYIATYLGRHREYMDLLEPRRASRSRGDNPA